MNKTPVFIVSALLVALSVPSGAQQQPAAGGAVMAASSPGKATVARRVTVTASVEAIDVANRHVTLKGPRGNVFELAVDPEVRNLDQVKVGDLVVVHYLEALSLTLKKNGKDLRAATESSGNAARAPAGRSPALRQCGRSKSPPT